MFQRLLRILLWSLHALAAVATLLWTVGRLANDRWHATQYLYWIPTPGMVFLLSVLLILVAALSPLLTSKGRLTHARTGLFASLVAVSIVFGAECNLERYLFKMPPQDLTQPSIRLLVWNPAVDRMDDFADRVASQDPQLIAIANRPGRTDWPALQDQVGGSRAIARFAHLSLVSRHRIIRWGGAILGIEGARKRTTFWPGGGEVSQDKGEALFVELDTRALLGRTLVVWLLDFPSDPELSRDANFAAATATLTGFRGRSYTRNPMGLDVEDDPAAVPVGFPPADLIVGDFNTPRGSSSIRRVTGTLRHAYDLAGRGWATTWPRSIPLIAIDHVFVAPWLDVRSYVTRDLGAGGHLAQIVDLAAN
ncbi:MAG: endonuclease/exonuclease/phosphatase family protein [Phycisphaerae bacterium]|jgi:hypothetical protein